ncbi:MAG: hypothetical protein JSS81_09665 [Acidobacteria bacterium]|nr:hypothetical protein [Acidobacteriota bacterium]
MAIHHKDKKRAANPVKPNGKPYRLIGVNEDGKPYFYWSDQPALFAACFSKNKRDWVWGWVKEPRKNGNGFHGDNIKPENRIFIADKETARKLEKAGITRPCQTCNDDEWNRYDADDSLQLKSGVEIE